MPLTTVMRRLLTGYAVTYNRRHHRHGYLFQNRYKSILCQEESYLLELVRYIHLNPLRAKLVPSLEVLDRYPYAGHSSLLGKVPRHWQAVAPVLARFARRLRTARQRYRAFVAEGIPLGKRPELTGGGLIRSARGWTAPPTLRQRGRPLKGDERILGESEFVEAVLHTAQEQLERRVGTAGSRLRFRDAPPPRGSAVRPHPGGGPDAGQHPPRVRARTVLCYWAVRKLGLPGTRVAAELGLTQPAVSRAIQRGERMMEEHRLRFPQD